MDAIPSINEMLSEPALIDFLSDNVPDYVNSLNSIVDELIKVEIFMATTNFRVQSEDEKMALIEGLRLTSLKVGNFMKEIVHRASGNDSSSSRSHDLANDWKETLDFLIGIMVSCNHLKKTEVEDELGYKHLDQIINSTRLKEIETYLLNPADSSNLILTESESRALLLMIAVPSLRELKESPKRLNLLLEVSKELDSLPQMICKACDEQSQAIFLIGSLLSLKQRAYDTWNRVKDDLCQIRESDNRAINNDMWHILTYCYDDLPHFLKPCFLHLTCYPLNYEISARSLTEIWIAEGFVTPEEGETIEETANKYLEQLVQRSLVCVSKRSFLDTIKYCQVRQSTNKFAIERSRKDGFLVANPYKEQMEYLFRIAIHHDKKNEYIEVENNHIHSFLAFDFDRNVLGSAVFLRVLELRKSEIPEAAFRKMTYLRYLGLRGSKISELPKDIGDMKNLQTLDVRDTSVETIPESLWNIKKLRHVYVKPSPQIKGPPSTADIDDLQVLKTVAVPESWLEDFPQYLSNLRKIALSNRDNNPDWKSNPYWKSISNLFSHMVNLLSMAIIGDILPSEFVDTRAFPNLETVKSIKLEGKWNCRNLFLDNVEFPTNLTKLTLSNSGLKEDPMPTLERLQALKLLCLKDEAYIGKKMVCSTNGFPELQFLKISKLGNLVNWIVEPMAMPKLTTLHTLECPNLIRDIPNLEHVTDKVINN